MVLALHIVERFPHLISEIYNEMELPTKVLITNVLYKHVCKQTEVQYIINYNQQFLLGAVHHPCRPATPESSQTEQSMQLY